MSGPDPLQCDDITPQHRAFELARRISLDRGGRWVLCGNYLPWADLAVAMQPDEAAAEAGRMLIYPPPEMHWQQACEWIGRAADAERESARPMEVAWLSGLALMYWPVHQRAQFTAIYGPFAAWVTCGELMHHLLPTVRSTVARR